MPTFKDIQDAVEFFNEYTITFQEGQILWAGEQKYMYKQGKWELLENNEMV